MAQQNYNTGTKPKFHKNFGSNYNRYSNYNQNNGNNSYGSQGNYNTQMNNNYNPNSRNFNQNYDEGYDRNYNDGNSQNYYDNYEPNYYESFGSSNGNQQNYFNRSNQNQNFRPSFNNRPKKYNGDQYGPSKFCFHGGYGPDFNQGFYESQFYQHQLKTFNAKICKIKKKPKVDMFPPKVKQNACWWTEECSVALRMRKTAMNKYRHRPTPENKKNLAIARSQARAIYKEAKKAAGIDPNPKRTAMLEQREKEKAEGGADGEPSNGVEDNSDAKDDSDNSSDENFGDLANSNEDSATNDQHFELKDDFIENENDQTLENLTYSILNEV